MVWLIVAVAAGVVYLVYSLVSGGGGGSVPDITAGQKATAPAAPPAASSPAPKAPTQTTTGGGIVGSGIVGGIAPPAAGKTESGQTTAPKEAPKGPDISKPAGGEKAAGSTSESLKKDLAGFKSISPGDIMTKKYEDLQKQLNDPAKLRFDQVGRNDVLTVVVDALPEELRPPRTGETNEENIAKFFRSAYGSMLIDQVDIQVHSVIAIGMVRYVNLTVDGSRFTAPEGSGIRAANGATVSIVSASDTSVVIVISALGVDKTKTFIR